MTQKNTTQDTKPSTSPKLDTERLMSVLGLVQEKNRRIGLLVSELAETKEFLKELAEDGAQCTEANLAERIDGASYALSEALA